MNRLAIVMFMAGAFVLQSCGGEEGSPQGTPSPSNNSIVVDPNPNRTSASWTLTGPNSYSHNGVGDETLQADGDQKSDQRRDE